MGQSLVQRMESSTFLQKEEILNYLYIYKIYI